MNIYLPITLFVCHWAADYTHLSRPYMLAAKRFGKPLTPIMEHALIHAVLTFLAVIPFAHSNRSIYAAFLIQLFTHFAIDVWKGRMNVWFPKLKNPANVFHWWVFGLDQLLHTIVILIICQIAQ